MKTETTDIQLADLSDDELKQLLLSATGGEFLLRPFKRLGLESDFIRKTLAEELRKKRKGCTNRERIMYDFPSG